MLDISTDCFVSAVGHLPVCFQKILMPWGVLLVGEGGGGRMITAGNGDTADALHVAF